MQGSQQEKLNSDQESHDSQNKLTQEFSTRMKISNDLQSVEKHEEEEGEGEGEDEEFSFVLGGGNNSPVAAEDAFADGQIKRVFPLFNRELLFSSDEPVHLPMKPPVKKVFVETIDRNSNDNSNDEISGPYCNWSSRKAVEASPDQICKKSNSTGFSKLWRFKELMGRSNSDGRDTYVFLNNNGHALPSVEEAPAAGGEVIVNEKKVKKKGGKSKTSSLSAHEVYLRSKAKEEEKRRSSSYLPYRPELMGFFTNVNGGLSKNVHPF